MAEYGDEIIHYNTDSMVCPHCGFYYYDCEDFTEDEAVETCVNCGEQFSYRKNIFITWDTDKI
jgi:DNA-directed RNA polymerase subunit RPC12/RpoP